MKKFVFTLTICILSLISLTAQESKFPSMDKSPMDAAHYPRTSAYNNYMDEGEKLDRQIKVLYCRPKKNDRVIFGELVPYGQEWRLGANEATEVTFYQPVEIGGTFIDRGTYTMFADVNEKNWTIKISTQRHLGGNENRDKSQDVASITIPVKNMDKSRESFTIGFQKINEGLAHMIFAWDKVEAHLPINLNPPYLASDDASPMDLVQYPAKSRMQNYLKPEEVAANQPKIRVVYSRPQRKDRIVFGELLKYNEPWRLGANETTEITFYETVIIGGNKVAPGTYGIMAYLSEGAWKVMIHTDIPSWGTHNLDEKKGVTTVGVESQKTGEMVENLSMLFDEKSEKEVHLVIAWEETMVAVPITFP